MTDLQQGWDRFNLSPGWPLRFGAGPVICHDGIEGFRPVDRIALGEGDAHGRNQLESRLILDKLSDRLRTEFLGNLVD
jgi:hypothetical protein